MPGGKVHFCFFKTNGVIVPSTRDLYKEVEALRRAVSHLQERNEALEDIVVKMNKKFEHYDKLLGSKSG
jgi:hypothetical protein